jgi:hypothetical protein
MGGLGYAPPGKYLNARVSKVHFQYFEGYFKGILVILNGYLTHNNCTNHKRIQSIKIIEKY